MVLKSTSATTASSGDYYKAASKMLLELSKLYNSELALVVSSAVAEAEDSLLFELCVDGTTCLVVSEDSTSEVTERVLMMLPDKRSGPMLAFLGSGHEPLLRRLQTKRPDFSRREQPLVIVDGNYEAHKSITS